MQIGQLAKRSGCKVETIRFYERERLLPNPPRSAGNYRVFSAEDEERLIFIRNCRSLGMALGEIRALLQFRDAPEADCRDVNTLLDRHILRLEQQIACLGTLDHQLRDIRQRCNDRLNPKHQASACGIIKTLGRAVPRQSGWT